MTHLQLRIELQDGRTIEFIPKFAYPLGVQELRSLGSSEIESIDLEFQTDDPVVDGKKQSGTTRLTSSIKFNEDTKIFGLVTGGWLPLPFVTPQLFLVDRNVVIALKKLNDGRTFGDAKSFQWWTKFFDEGAATFNPLPYAFESGLRRVPTKAEFRASFEEGVAELEKAFPKCTIITYDNRVYDAVYTQLRSFDERGQKELEFLLEVCPIVSDRKSEKDEQAALQLILQSAKERGLAQGSFVLLAALSCLFEVVGGSQSQSVGKS